MYMKFQMYNNDYIELQYYKLTVMIDVGMAL